MTKLRVEWTKEEDTILLISKVAGSYLCQNSIAVANSMVPYVIGKIIFENILILCIVNISTKAGACVVRSEEIVIFCTEKSCFVVLFHE